MYPEERQQAIAQLVGQRGRLSVTSTAEQFGVTTETVRRDLAVLERAGMLRRVHGGAVPVNAVALVELGLGERTGRLAEQKDKIAAVALEFLPGPNGSIVLDGGTTTAAMAELLPSDRQLLVVTDAVPIAARLATAPGISVHMLGGRVRGVTQCAVGEAAVRTLGDLRVDVAFMGTNGITTDYGFTTPDEDEALVKRAMVERRPAGGRARRLQQAGTGDPRPVRGDRRRRRPHHRRRRGSRRHRRTGEGRGRGRRRLRRTALPVADRDGSHRAAGGAGTQGVPAPAGPGSGGRALALTPAVDADRAPAPR